MLLLLKLQALACNFTNSNTPSYIVSPFYIGLFLPFTLFNRISSYNDVVYDSAFIKQNEGGRKPMF